MSEDLVHLHTHSDQSAFDGLGKPKEFIALAAKMGQPAIALTEHGSLRGLYEASIAADEHGVKLIPAVEAYLADDASQRGLTKEEKDAIKAAYKDPDEGRVAAKQAEKLRRERDHITVWAMNDVGLANLYKLNAYAWTKGFYYKPRIDLDVLAAHSEGIAVSSGCPGGVVTSPIRAGNISTALERATRLAEVFGDRFLVEVMPHVPDPDCVGLAEKLVRLADHLGATVIATQDAHYPGAADADVQDALLCIQTRSKIADPDRFAFDVRDYWLKGRGAMLTAFRDKVPGLPSRTVERALGATVAFAERCSAKVQRAKPGAYLAAPEVPAEFGGDFDAYLMRLAFVGAGERRIDLPRAPDYRARLGHELRVIRDLGFAAYFVMVWEVQRWARSVGILCGPGRGSAAGSLVAFLLRITDVDPIEHGLLFERFLAPGRLDLPDIDLDFEHRRRDEIIGHLRDLYGEDHVASISTAITLGGRGTLRDLGRIFEVPNEDIEKVASLIHGSGPEEERSEDELARILVDTKTGREFASRYPDVAAVAGRLEGNLRTVGLHPAGIVVSARPVSEVVPIESRGQPGGVRVAVTAYDMKGVEGSGLVKLDALGLKTLTMLSLAFDASGTSSDGIDIADPETLAGFCSGTFAGVFQFDTPAARRICADFEFERFADVAAMTALNRPGPLMSGLAARFLERAAGHATKLEPYESHPVYARTFAETHGVPVYQEQVVILVRDLCGYTPEEADKFRKKVSKKLGLSDEAEKFVEGAKASGLTEREAESLFGALEGFASYAFNKAHSVSYAHLAWWCMWLKVHHPAEFYAAALQIKDDTAVQLRLAAEARGRSIPVVPPSVNAPHAGFRARVRAGKSEIVGGLSDVKGIGPKAAKAIAEAAPFTSLADFHDRASGVGKVTGASFKALAKASALREVFPHSRFLAVNAAAVWARLRKGSTLVIETPPPAYEGDAEAVAVAEVWPLYRGVTGRTAFDARLDAVRKALPGREVMVPGDEALQVPGGHFVLARAGDLKLYDEGDGKKTGRGILVSADGAELPARVDSDVADLTAHLFAAGWPTILALVWVSKFSKKASLESAWSIGRDGSLDLNDPVLAWAAGDAEGIAPRAPAAMIAKRKAGDRLGIAGVLARTRAHRDRSGAWMQTWGLLGPRDYTRVLVFASRNAEKDARRARGDVVAFRAEVLDKGGACVSRAPVRSL